MANAVLEAEKEIEGAFEASPLVSLARNQAVWTLLAANEDKFLKYHNERPHEEMYAVVDTLLNALTHPLRTCLKCCPSSKNKIRRVYIPDEQRLSRT